MLLAGGYYHVINRGNNRSAIFLQPGDYRSFLALIDDAQERIRLRLLAYCLMPNHVHLVVSPDGATAISRWMHWLMTTHTHRHHLRYGTSGCLWQGRFRAFPVKHDGHLLTVMRYVERNALRAGLVERAEHWPWGSLALRLRRNCDDRLAEPPIMLPANWFDWVNDPQSPAELEALRECVNGQRPFGDARWIANAAECGGPERIHRSRGRPRK